MSLDQLLWKRMGKVLRTSIAALAMACGSPDYGTGSVVIEVMFAYCRESAYYGKYLWNTTTCLDGTTEPFDKDCQGTYRTACGEEVPIEYGPNAENNFVIHDNRSKSFNLKDFVEPTELGSYQDCQSADPPTEEQEHDWNALQSYTECVRLEVNEDQTLFIAQYEGKPLCPLLIVYRTSEKPFAGKDQCTEVEKPFHQACPFPGAIVYRPVCDQ